MVVSVILGQVELGGVHLAHRLHRDLLGLEELVEPAVFVLLNGGEGVDSVASCVHLYVKGSVGSAGPGEQSYSLPVITVISQFHIN